MKYHRVDELFGAILTLALSAGAAAVLVAVAVGML